MPRTASDIKQKDVEGGEVPVAGNLKKYPAATDALKDLSLIEKSSLFDEYEANPKKYLSVEELRKALLEHLETLPWKK